MRQREALPATIAIYTDPFLDPPFFKWGQEGFDVFEARNPEEGRI